MKESEVNLNKKDCFDEFMVKKDIFDYVFIGVIFYGFYLIFAPNQNPERGLIIVIVAVLLNSIRKKWSD